MHVVHFVGVIAEHVEHGRTQFWLQVWVEVRKNPSIHEIHPVAVQLLQLLKHCIHVFPDKKNPVPQDKHAPGCPWAQVLHEVVHGAQIIWLFWVNSVYPDKHWVQLVALEHIKQFYGHPCTQVELLKKNPLLQLKHTLGWLELWQVKQFDEHVEQTELERKLFG